MTVTRLIVIITLHMTETMTEIGTTIETEKKDTGRGLDLIHQNVHRRFLNLDRADIF